MPDLTVTCSRCGRQVDGYEDKTATSGFYRISPDGMCSQFANPGETVICDDCMWSDERYLAIYPHMRQRATTREDGLTNVVEHYQV
jgi:hypothetical protein